ncbi:hypothetical protein PoB_004251600 [Plakobranchus ocellatus]|uniref:Uncharacterized protein n=1 Tax=Plakobranchus ocellatus TaxID=259542 RepID=A0AAV4B6D7_9GAST|nr:hypothetical protein PoB_004251600 [Plakobranchus ocellatus]
MDLYQNYMQLADNLGVDKGSRLEWVQSRVDREIEQREREQKHERAAERAAEMKIQEEIVKQKQLDAFAKKDHTRSRVLGSKWRSAGAKQYCYFRSSSL